MENKNLPPQKWEELRKEILDRIEAIDKETPWSETEPSWWLQMSYVRKILINKFQ